MDLLDRLFAWGLRHGEESQQRLYGEHKQALFEDLSALQPGSTVLEIGPGTGVNFDYLPDGISWIGLEPNPHMHQYVEAKTAQRNIEVDLRETAAESILMQDNSIDAAISTLVICSVDDPRRVLSEIRRILRPGAPFYFIEHVAAPSYSWLRRIQHFICPLWMCLADGCHPDRETGPLVNETFYQTDISPFRVSLPLPITPHIKGVAHS